VNVVNGSSAFTAVVARQPGARRRSETVWQFLERSSQPEAVAARAQWDDWLSRMPQGARDAFIRRLQDRTDGQVRAVLAELITFALLDSVYPAVEIDPATGSGSRADFAVGMPVRTYFEVKRPSPSKGLVTNARRQGDIAGALAKIDSPDFWLDVQVRSDAHVPSMRRVRQEAEDWLASLDYEAEVQRRREYQRDRLAGANEEMPGLDAGPAERAAYLAAGRPLVPPAFERSGAGWSVRITAHPRAADQRGSGQFTIGIRSAGEAHVETVAELQAAVRQKLKQHTGLAHPLVVVLDLSSPIIEDHDIAAMLYGPVTTTVADPATSVATTRERHEGIWPEPPRQPVRPAAVLTFRGIWLGSREATAELWLPPDSVSPLLPGPWIVRTLAADGLGVEKFSRRPLTVSDTSKPC
jgi:hypothetical protein